MAAVRSSPQVPSLPYPIEPLRDGVIALRDTAERDIPEILIAHQDDPELYLRIGLARPPSGAELGSAAEREQAERAAGKGARLTVVADGRDDLVGLVEAHNLDWDHRRAELVIWLAPRARCRGWGRRALRLVAGWLLRRAGIERVGLLVERDNEPMLRAAQSAGFVAEGVLRAYASGPDGRRDFVTMSMIPEDLERI